MVDSLAMELLGSVLVLVRPDLGGIQDTAGDHHLASQAAPERWQAAVWGLS